MPDLYPSFEMPQLVEQQATPQPKYGKSWRFDFVNGDFVLDGAGRVMPVSGHEAWGQWCVKAVLTERFAYLAYGPNYGAELEQALKRPSRKAIELEVKRVITEALLADPRTEMVQDFLFRWDGDRLYVSFTVTPVVGTQERIEVKLSA